jgi:hypothetical protein
MEEVVPLSCDAFFDCCTLVVSRMEVYPAIDPEGWLVGFTATCDKNGYRKFAFGTVPLAAAGDKPAMEIAEMAWTQVAAEMLKWGAFASTKGPLVGQAVEFRGAEAPPLL